MAPAKDVLRIGPHQFWCEGDLSIVEVVGDVEAEHVATMQQASRPLFNEYGYTLTLVDARRARTMTPEARRTSAVYQRTHSVPGVVAIFGVSAMLSALVALYSRAIALFSTTQRQTAMFPTEAEARTWLASQRVRLRAVRGLY